jgi:hypothetical protein
VLLIVCQVQDDLRHLREQISNAVEGRSVEKLDLKGIEKAIARTELGVKVYCNVFVLNAQLSSYIYHIIILTKWVEFLIEAF